jgi:hypothetical protein
LVSEALRCYYNCCVAAEMMLKSQAFLQNSWPPNEQPGHLRAVKAGL